MRFSSPSCRRYPWLDGRDNIRNPRPRDPRNELHRRNELVRGNTLQRLNILELFFRQLLTNGSLTAALLSCAACFALLASPLTGSGAPRLNYFVRQDSASKRVRPANGVTPHNKIPLKIASHAIPLCRFINRPHDTQAAIGRPATRRIVAKRRLRGTSFDFSFQKKLRVDLAALRQRGNAVGGAKRQRLDGHGRLAAAGGYKAAAIAQKTDFLRHAFDDRY